MTGQNSPWWAALRADPIPALLAGGDEALSWSVRHDLLGQELSPQPLWQLPRAARLLRAQQPSGAWRHHGARSAIRSAAGYDQLATYQALLDLVAKYRLDRRHPAFQRAARFLLGSQTPKGDLRGIYANQYSPNYTAAILALLIDGGWRDDARVRRRLDWLLQIRQDDGGWAIPLRTVGQSFPRAMQRSQPLQPDRARPFSHLVTGIVVRALAAHPDYHRTRPETHRAARLLASRFFQPDRYPDRRAATYWRKLAYPFRWTDLVAALDALALVGLDVAEPSITRALAWLRAQQGPDGLWRAGYQQAADPSIHRWVSFAIVRVLRRFTPPGPALHARPPDPAHP